MQDATLRYKMTHRHGTPIGQRLYAERVNKGYSQREMAAAIGISTMAYSRLERGLTARPNPANAKAIADYFGVTVVELFDAADTPIAAVA